MVHLAWLVAFFSLAAWVLNIAVGPRNPRLGAGLPIAGAALGLALALGVLAGVVAQGPEAPPFHRAVEWARLGEAPIEFGYRVDGLTAVMLVVVCLVSLLAQVFSLGYMSGDRRYTRYFGLLAFFTFSMLGLVLADGFLLLFIFWELVGTASYLLIGHWYEDPGVARAALKAFMTTRVGDLFLMLGIFILFAATGTFGFDAIGEAVGAGQVAPGAVTAAAILIFFGAASKSAQVPLHAWLPDAMAGPTPVSALIHAATMVAAGVYLVARSYPIFAASPTALATVAWIGGATAFLAATLGLVMTDIKKVLAYSTISQLGYMMAALGVGAFTAGLFHLFTHAFFKALLFLAAGSVIHAAGNQEMPELGGLWKRMPLTFWTWLAGALALAGIPPLGGFFSKDEILLGAFRAGWLPLFWVLVAVAFLTALYIGRATVLTFLGDFRGGALAAAGANGGGAGGGHGHHGGHGPAEGHGSVHESPPVMTVPLLVLAAGTLLVGFLNTETTGFAFTRLVFFGEAHELEPSGFVRAWAVGAAAAGLLAAYWLYGLRPAAFRERLREAFGPLYGLLQQTYYFDDLYRVVFAGGTVELAMATGEFDRSEVDGAVNGAARLVAAGARVFRRAQTGLVSTYLLTFFAGLLVALLLFVALR